MAPVLVSATLVFTAIFAATPTAAVDTELNVTNAAPIVESVTLSTSSITPSAGSTTSVSPTLVVSDVNGCSDIDNVKVTVLKPDDTVHVAEAAATYQSCSAGTAATYTYSFNMNFYDAPALDTTYYKIKVTATDSQGATGDNLLDLTLFNYLELVALNVAEGTLDYGSGLNPGDTSSINSLTIQNHGNVAIDTDLSGTDMSHATESASIPVASSAYSTNSDMSASSTLSGTATTLDLNVAAGSSSSSPVYWRLTVPSGEDQWVPSGDYSGTLTVSALKSS